MDTAIQQYKDTLDEVREYYDFFTVYRTISSNDLDAMIKHLSKRISCINVESIIYEIMTRNGCNKKQVQGSVWNFIAYTENSIFTIPTMTDKDLLGDGGERLRLLENQTNLSKKDILLFGLGFNQVLQRLFFKNDIIEKRLKPLLPHNAPTPINVTSNIDNNTKSMIMAIIKDGNIRGQSKISTLRKIRDFLIREKVQIPSFKVFFDTFGFGNKSDYSKVRNEQPPKKNLVKLD